MTCTGRGSSGWRREKASRRWGEGGGTVRRGDGAAYETVEIAQPSLADAPLHEVEAARDALQQVVEVVGDAARELADRLHLLRLSQRVFGRAQFGRAGLDPRLQRGVQPAQGGLGLAALDHLAGALGDLLHEGDLAGLPVTDRAVVEIDDGTQAAGPHERHDEDGARVDGAGGGAGLFLVAQRIGLQIVHHHGLACAEPVHDLDSEGAGRDAAEQRLGASVGPAHRVVEHILDRI